MSKTYKDSRNARRVYDKRQGRRQEKERKRFEFDLFADEATKRDRQRKKDRMECGCQDHYCPLH